MTASKTEREALRYLSIFEAKGKQVARVVIDGRRIEFEFARAEDSQDEFDKVDMRHGKA